jgi:hypothetical protein
MINLSPEQLFYAAAQIASGNGSIKSWANHYHSTKGIPSDFTKKQLKEYIESVRK